MDQFTPPTASSARGHDRGDQQDGQDRLGGDEPWRSIPPSGIRHRLTEDKSVAGVGYRIGESDDDVMATGRDRGSGQPVPVHAHQARQQWLGSDQRTTIKARGSYDPHHEAGSMTAPRPKVAATSKKVLAMRTPSIDDCVDDTHSTASMCQNVADSN